MVKLRNTSLKTRACLINARESAGGFATLVLNNNKGKKSQLYSKNNGSRCCLRLIILWYLTLAC